MPARTPRWSGSSRRRTRRSRWRTSLRSSPRRTTPAPASSSTTPSSRRCCSGRSSSAPTSSVHSATKYLAGHSDVQLGAVVTGDDELYAVLKGRRDVQGNIPGPFEAWLALRGLRTLHLRVERAQVERRGAGPAAGRPPGLLAEVRYPGMGAMVSIVLPTADHADLLVRATSLWVRRDQPRGRRVDLRAAAPMEVRAGQHPRGPGATLGRHRGRRGPLGRPVAGAGRVVAPVAEARGALATSLEAN